MATRTVVTVICDMPHDVDVDTAFPVTITTPDGTWTLDLCPDHASALLPFVAAAPSSRPANQRGRRMSQGAQ